MIVHIVGSSPELDEVNLKDELQGCCVAAISGSGRYLVNRGVDLSYYGALERDNAKIYKDDIEEFRSMFGDECQFIYSKYADNLCRVRGWNAVPQEDRFIYDMRTHGPQWATVGKRRPRHTVTAGMGMAAYIAYTQCEKVEEIHFWGCNGYRMGEEVYAEGIVGESDKTDDEWRAGSNTCAARMFCWLTNKYSHIKFVFHGEPVYKDILDEGTHEDGKAVYHVESLEAE